MAKQIDFTRVANKLILIYSTHKTDNNQSVWQREFKDILNAQEVKRLYDAFSGVLQFLESSGGRNLSWSKRANKDNFTSKWCQHIFEKYAIQSTFGPTLGPNGKALHPRTNYTRKSDPISVVEAPVQEQVFDCSHFSDELLVVAAEAIQKEIIRREEEHKRKEEQERYHAKLQTILQTFKEMATSEGVSWEDIINTDSIV